MAVQGTTQITDLPDEILFKFSNLSGNFNLRGVCSQFKNAVDNPETITGIVAIFFDTILPRLSKDYPELFSMQYDIQQIIDQEGGSKTYQNIGKIFKIAQRRLQILNSFVNLDDMKCRGISQFSMTEQLEKTAAWLYAQIKPGTAYHTRLTTVQGAGFVLRSIPEILKTLEICLAAVQNYGRALQYVPENLKTLEVCLAAVKQDGKALQYVPEILKTLDICLAAAEQNRRALKYVPENLRRYCEARMDCEDITESCAWTS